MKNLIKILTISTCIMMSVASFSAVADDAGSEHITAKVSTMGIGVEYNHPVNSVLSVGFGANRLGINRSFNDGGIDYNGDIDFKSLSIIANYHPWQNSFRLRAGVYYNGNEVDLSANANDLTVGDEDFTGADVSLNGNLSFQRFAPYIGIGYGSEPVGNDNFSFDLDIGVMRSPVAASLTGACFVGGVQNAGVCADNNFDTELANERNDLLDDVDGFDLYPVISLGVTYRF